MREKANANNGKLCRALKAFGIRPRDEGQRIDPTVGLAGPMQTQIFDKSVMGDATTLTIVVNGVTGRYEMAQR